MMIKRMTALLAAALLAMGAVSPVTAADTVNAPLTLEYKDIEQQVLANNLQVKNNEATIQNMKFNRVTESTQDTTSDLNDGIQSALYNLDSLLSSGVSEDVAAVVGSTKLSLSLIQSMYTAMAGTQNTQYSSYSQQMSLTKLQLEQANDQMVNAAKSLFATYHQLLLNINQLESSQRSLEESLKAQKVQLSLGMTTAFQVSETDKSLSQLKNNISDLKNQTSTVKQELNKLLGRSTDAPLTLGSLPTATTEQLQKLNPDTDSKKAVENNYTIRYKEQELTYLKKHPTGDSRVDNNNRKMKKNEIESETQAVKSSLKQQYYTIEKQKNTLTAEEQALKIEQQKLDQLQKKYNLGKASGLELKTQKNTVAAQEATVKSARATLFWNMESYQSMVNGLPASN